MDPSAPKTVGKGVAGNMRVPTVCGATAALYGVLGGHPPARLALFSAVNGGLAAATFFSIREYIVGPVLTLTHVGNHHTRRKESESAVDGFTGTEPALSWSHIRTSRLLDSAISGGIAGGVLNAWKRGKVGLVPGLGTGALLCTLLQWGVNELHIFRIRHVYRTTTTSLPVIGDKSDTHQEAESWGDRILSAFGRRVSNDDYLKRLKTERDTYLRRIEELERELQEKPR
ncbi:hypothetical protein F5J12DRAFT_903426 [Pisolithus orientalis]|uniref:uncharacterized protein n=1 Tax=Pisolithus orientalis TaxID=936130 RepID=UPI002224580C|nr:uncharacterized protein F5J12DRAFT_903426 [Pisolithus orientalis]KAI6028458.1 hypothetical protein F5J12DRAFT_903426 [Pisolithus orientalis]